MNEPICLPNTRLRVETVWLDYLNGRSAEEIAHDRYLVEQFGEADAIKMVSDAIALADENELCGNES